MSAFTSEEIILLLLSEHFESMYYLIELYCTEYGLQWCSEELVLRFQCFGGACRWIFQSSRCTSHLQPLICFIGLDVQTNCSVRLNPILDTLVMDGSCIRCCMFGSVRISSRLVDTPSVVVTSKTGWSSNMERVMLAQVLVDTEKAQTMTGQRSLDINHRHPIIQALRKKVALDPKV